MDKPLFPIPPGFRLLEDGADILETDVCDWKVSKSFTPSKHIYAGEKVRYTDLIFFFRPIEGEAPKAVEGSRLTSEEFGTAGAAGAEAPTEALKIGDVVRVLPIIREIHESEDDHPSPGVVREMLEAIGKELPILHISAKGDFFLSWHPFLDEGWDFRPEWVEKVAPVEGAPPLELDLLEAFENAVIDANNKYHQSPQSSLDREVKETREAIISRFSALEGALRLGLDAINGSLQPHISITLEEITSIRDAMAAALQEARP